MNKITYKKTLLNSSEAALRGSIAPVLVMLGTEYHILSQVALSALIDPDQLPPRSPEWSQCMNGNVDFLVILGSQQEPLFAVEHDGSIHRTSDRKKRNDRIKNELFQRAELLLVRISDLSEHKLNKPVELINIVNGEGGHASFLQYAIWFLTVHRSIERLIKHLYEGTFQIETSNGVTDSDKLTDDQLFRYDTYLDQLRHRILGYLGPTNDIIHAFGEDLNTPKNRYWCDDIDTFAMMYRVTPSFRFRRVTDGILGEGCWENRRWSSPAIRLTAVGIDQEICDNLALSYHVRYFLGQIGAVLQKRENDAENERLASMTTAERCAYKEAKQQRVRQIRERTEELKQRQRQLKDRYGPDELLLCSDERIRRDLDKYKWTWEKFIKAGA